MALPPSTEIVSAIENGVAEITRRIEVFENDGVTPWKPTLADRPDTNRLVSGSVSIDYNSDERRKADITILNDDFAYRLNPVGGFYYDKVIKLYRGIKYPFAVIQPKIALIETDYTGNNLMLLMRLFGEAGYTVDDRTAAASLADVQGYTILVAARGSGDYTKSALLKEGFKNGMGIVTMGKDGTGATIPHTTGGGPFTGTGGFFAVNTDNPLKGRVGANYTATTSGNRVSAINSFGQVIAIAESGATDVITMSVGTNIAGAYWFDYHTSDLVNNRTEKVQNIKATLNFLQTKGDKKVTWEWQLGEFQIDSVADQIFPNQLKVTMRDNTKILLKDKLTFTSTFVAGTSLHAFVRAVAANAGITKFRESIGTETFPNDMSFERDTERWKMIKDACVAFDYEVYFDNEGYLVVRKFNDPTTSPIFHHFGTGSTGNLVSFDRSMNDGRIFNIINIFGDPPNNDRLPFFGQAINDDVNSPTSIYRLHKRPWTFSANYFSSDQECIDLARSRLSIMGLESYEINFSSLYYPWMEVGEIAEILDPHRNTTDPTRFLMDSITLPIDLGPMSGTAKRVTLVGNRG